MKALSPAAKDLLVEIIVENTVALALNKLTEIGELVQRGYIKSASSGVSATTKGVHKALLLKLVKQDGVEFITPEGKRSKRPAAKPTLTVVPQRQVQSNAWDMGFEDARTGAEPSGPFMAEPDYMAGYRAFGQAQVDLKKTAD